MTPINPLLESSWPVPFTSIATEHVVPGIRRAITEAEAEVERISASAEGPTWENTFLALEDAIWRLNRRLAPVTHLVAVAESPGLREAYNTVLPEITAFHTDLFLREDLWERVHVFSTAGAPLFDQVGNRHLDRTVRAFKRAGAQLSLESKAKLREVRVELSGLEQKFAENVLDATAAYELVVEDESRMEGIPADALRRARIRAGDRAGWAFGLDQPAVEAVLKYARDRELRREIFMAYSTRCREGENSNVALLARILNLRESLAHLLGYADFADYQLEERMLTSGKEALKFEDELFELSLPYYERDLAQLRERAAREGFESLEPWDTAFVIELLRREEYDLDAELLRPYFPLPRVLEGLFAIARRVFGFVVERVDNDDVWYPDVEYYEVRDIRGTLLGAFYADWFPRPEKRQGAWMCDLVTGERLPDGGFAPHLAAVCANFAPPDGDAPALLRHRDVCTVYHEFGHLLHHIASQVEIRSRAGINVAWDWVELPSQLMENWAWEIEAAGVISSHHENGEPIPDELFGRLERTRTFMGGWAMMRQLAFGWIDLKLHTSIARGLRTIESGLASARTAGDGDAMSDALDPEGLTRLAGASLMAEVEGRLQRFMPESFAAYHPIASFLHIFSGGYAAGYYSYMWSAVLDADVFSRFRTNGIFNSEVGSDYVDSILSRGDSARPSLLFRAFMNRGPDTSALLERELGSLTDSPHPAKT